MSSEAAPPATTAPWQLRLLHTISQVATVVAIWWFAGMGRLYGATFQELSMTPLPAVTDIVIHVSGVILHPAVLIVGGAAVLALIVVGHFGLIARVLLPLIGVDILLIGLMVMGWLVGLQQPMRKIQEQLGP